jgi:hypothetical protein
MQVNIIEEAGYSTALYGFSLSYKDRAIPREGWWCFKWDGADYCAGCKEDNDCLFDQGATRVSKTATANAGRGMGHDKWLRHVQVWVDIEAPRYWWSEFDTYKVGTVTQSESTMHTLMKRKMELSDLEPFTYAGAGLYQEAQVENFNSFNTSDIGSIQELKALLPESYLQRRVVSLNYAVLRCIIDQRKGHRLPEWHTFIDTIYSQCQHPELLPSRGE